jgi:drug/metabolite transporter (DMT)-like permease
VSRSGAAFLSLCLIWGSTWLFIKLGLRDLPPISFAGLRFVLAAAILWAVVLMRGVPLPRRARDWGFLAVTGILQFTLDYGLLFWGEQRTSSGLAAVLQATIPAFGLVFAHFMLPDERLTLPKVSGVVLGILGVGLIFSDQLAAEGREALRGSVAIVAAAASVALANVLVKRRGRDFHPAVISAVQMLFGLVPLLAVGFALEGSPLSFHWTPLAWVSLVYLAIVGSVVAFLIYYWLVQRMDVTKTMLVPLVTPVIAVLLGMATLGERLTWRMALGTAAIVSGVAWIMRSRSTTRPDGPKPAIAGATTPVDGT